jgi:hypothetical protein
MFSTNHAMTNIVNYWSLYFYQNTNFYFKSLNINYMNKLLLVILTFCSLSLSSQIDSSFALTGSVDVYFRRNLNSTNDPTNKGTIAPLTSFANLPGFSMGMANLIGTYQKDKVKFVADLVIGPRGKDAVFNSPAPLNILNQMYVAYTLDKFTFTLGKFNTFVGYEVIGPVGNTHYSTSHLFSYGPFNHTGLKIGYDLGSGFSAMAALMNPTDFTDSNPADAFTTGLQLGYSSDLTNTYLNALFSKDFYQYDLTSIIKPTTKYALGLNASIAKDAFSGLAIYNTYSASETVDVAARVEYFTDKGLGILTGTNASVVDLTLSLPIKAGNFRLVPEFRIDLYGSDEKLKTVLTDGVKNTSSDKLSSFVLAAIANF